MADMAESFNMWASPPRDIASEVSKASTVHHGATSTYRMLLGVVSHGEQKQDTEM